MSFKLGTVFPLGIYTTISQRLLFPKDDIKSLFLSCSSYTEVLTNTSYLSITMMPKFGLVWFSLFVQRHINSYRLFNTEIWLICKYLTVIQTIYRFGLAYLFNGILTPYGLFNAKIWFISEYLIVIKTILFPFV